MFGYRNTWHGELRDGPDLGDIAYSACFDILNAMTVAEMIRSARQNANFSQAELAERLATTQSAVSRWERGHDEPRISTLASILHACGRRLVLESVADDVDIAQIRQHLAMTPEQRLAATTNVNQFLAQATRR